MARVTTGRGDEGYTDLLGPGRVPKYHPRPEAYGTVDEATSVLGLARAHLAGEDAAEQLYTIQRHLYTLMAELATPLEVYDKATWKIENADVERLEAWEEELKQRVEIGKEFIIPGGTVAGATLDLARTIVRRAERQVARLYHDGEVTNPVVLRYLNRLSDYLFILARRVEAVRK
ncbi:MAG TPA: cob(I)yrinic acid a,c-diamide adenosyltransferase [Chloroflexota bacterium]|nr:cob(I)yrinic acid a,c-diamide adenosyltransferase [Chloroflexota bacterium]